MRPEPVKRYRNPSYPTRLEVLSDPDLLRRHLPPGWRGIPGMAGSIALFLAANSMVKGAEKSGPAEGTTAVVAPLFDHGEGRGSTGCIVVAPPVFLSEEEAWQVIDEELAKDGVKLPDSKVTLDGVQIPQKWITYTVKDGKMQQGLREAGRADSFIADRGDSKKHVALEFISSREYHNKTGGASSSSTVQSYDFKATAKNLGDEVKKQSKEKLYFGVLYDPLVNVAAEQLNNPLNQPGERFKHWKEDMDKSRADSKRLLRLQVQDFVKWLQAQGAI